MSSKKIAVIIGAGPAGLTAAYELLERTDIVPILVELTDDVGGICKTINYKGNRMDVGGHRFFSKSDRVMNWWLKILPLQKLKNTTTTISYQNQNRDFVHADNGPDPEATDKVMLLRKRKSRIYFLRSFFDYPITLSLKTLSQLGPMRVVKIGFSYLKSLLFQIKPEVTLEDFFVNRFGKELYLTFFKSYTEKVWGQSCKQINADWGRQRIKGLSIGKSILHFLKRQFAAEKDLAQKKTETSLIQYFLYPKLGPGQLWEEVAEQIKTKGGKILLQHTVNKINTSGNRITSVSVKNLLANTCEELDVDYIFSSMPVITLAEILGTAISAEVLAISKGLQYRDFISVGLLVKKLNTDNKSIHDRIEDNWIYIQEPDVKLGRLQVFNNWSPYLVADKNTYWLGLEYFCNEGDDLWKKTEKELLELATEELCKIDIIKKEDVLDGTVIRMPKAYPAYFGTYPDFKKVRDCTDQFENLFLIGRNGMHKYNNQDHSMLTAMVAVDNIVNAIKTKENIWQINTEEGYHEE